MGRSSRRSRCRYGCPPPHYTHTRAEISMCTRDIDIHACYAQAQTRHGRMRAEVLAKGNRGETKKRREPCIVQKISHSPKSKAVADKAEQRRTEVGERERRALIVVLLYNPLPASAVAAAGVLVAASRVLAREPAPSRHTRALIRPVIISCSKNAAQYFHVSATHKHETKGTKAQAAAQSAPLPLSLATRASQSATTSA